MSTREQSAHQVTSRVAEISGTLLLILLIQSTLIWNPTQFLSAADNGLEQAAGCNASAYEVQPGDTINGVASRSGTTSQHVRDCNGLSSDVVYAGQVLNLPGEVNSNQGTTLNVRFSRTRPTPQASSRYQGTNNGPSANGQRGRRHR